MANAQITRKAPAAKVATKSAKVAAPKAATPAKKAGRTVRKAPAKPALAFMLHPYARPSAGNRLAAYTSAWMFLTGMAEGKPVAGALVRELAGDTAIAWHIKQGNFERTAEGIKLTDVGMSAFGSRIVDPEIANGFLAVLTKGEASDAAGIKSNSIKAA